MGKLRNLGAVVLLSVAGGGLATGVAEADVVRCADAVCPAGEACEQGECVALPPEEVTLPNHGNTDADTGPSTGPDAGADAGAEPLDPTEVGVGGDLSGVDPELDSDRDGVPDVQEGTGDADGDGVPAHLDGDERGGRIPGNDAGTDPPRSGSGCTLHAGSGAQRALGLWLAIASFAVFFWRRSF